MKPERYVLIWSVWAKASDQRWLGRELHVPLVRRFNPFAPLPEKPDYDELVFRRSTFGGFQIVECEGVIVHDARTVA